MSFKSTSGAHYPPDSFNDSIYPNSGNADSGNVQGPGITIDMTGLASVKVNKDRTVASVDAGASWLDVYLYLDGLGVAVAGGRNAAVGVGGLTLGGPSFLDIS